MKSLCLLIGIAALHTAAMADPLAYTSAAVSCSGFYNSGTETFPCGNVTDDIVNDGTGEPGSWSFWLGRQATGYETITIDLGAEYTLDQIDIYNTHNRSYNDRGALDFLVWISSTPASPTNNPGDTFGTLILDNSLSFNTTDPNPAQSFSTFLSNPTGRYLTFRADSYYSQGAGLSEIDLFGSPASVGAVPEPATTALMGAGVLVLAALRRRRA